MTVSKLRELLEGLLEVKPVLRRVMNKLVEDDQFALLSGLAIIAHFFYDIDERNVSKQLRVLETFPEEGIIVLDRYFAETVDITPSAPKASNTKRRPARSAEEVMAERAETDRIRTEIRKLHARNPGQSNHQMKAKLAKKSIDISVQRINGFRAVLNGVGFHGNGQSGGRRKKQTGK